MRQLFILALVVSFIQSQGQSFTAEAAVAPVETDGFYNIFISPAINAHLNNEFSDIRIFDAQGHEVPYLLQKELPANHINHFVEYEILKKESKSNCCTALLLRNANRTPINNIHLIIKNAEARRRASLMGSDDNQTWFSIKDHFILDAPRNDNGTHEIKIVGFPWSNYEFYQLRINDSTNAPLNILEAGYYADQSSDGKFTILPLKITSYDSAAQKKTYVNLLFNTTQFVDKLEIDVSGVRYYRRNARLFEKRVRTRKGERKEYYNPIENFELTTGRKAIIDLTKVRGQEFLIEIENEDNPPLVISSVKGFQLNRYLTAWLHKDTQYTIQFGQHTLSPPVYDLGFFKDSIPKGVKILEPGEIKILTKSGAETQETFFTDKNIIWAAIVVVMLILGYMSVKLIRESATVKPKD
jgi:hypothetical protein